MYDLCVLCCKSIAYFSLGYTRLGRAYPIYIAYIAQGQLFNFIKNKACINKVALLYYTFL